MDHSRFRNIQQIPLSRLRAETPKQTDKIFHKIVMDDILGKVVNGLTRMSNERITTGFFARDQRRIFHVTELPYRHVAGIVDCIRQGMRPPIEIYWNPLAPGGGSYVCPDHEVALAAYRELSIKIVPVVILKPKSFSEAEGCLWVQPALHGYARLLRCVSSSSDGYGAFSEVLELGCGEALALLARRTVECTDIVERFHRPAPGAVHYHEMLHAVLRRHARSLDSIRLLIGLGRLEHAAFVVRSCYEAYLNFYLDWLSPDFLGPKIQYLAMRSLDPDVYAEIDHVKDFQPLIENARKKALLSNLGDAFYDHLYKPFSRMVHQSYDYVAREGFGFADEPDEPETIEVVQKMMNIITFSLLTRVLNEVGEEL